MNFKQPTKLTMALLISVVFNVFLGGAYIIWGLVVMLLGAIALSLNRPQKILTKTDFTKDENQAPLLPVSNDKLDWINATDFKLQSMPNTFSSIISYTVAKGGVMTRYAVGKRASHLRVNKDGQFVRLYKKDNHTEVYIKCGNQIGENLIRVSQGKMKSHHDSMWYGIDARYISANLLNRLIDLTYWQITISHTGECSRG